MLSIPNSTKGLFNNNVEHIWPNFEPYPFEWTFYIIPKPLIVRPSVDFLLTTYVPISASPRLYWMIPNIMLAPHGTNINCPERVPNSCLPTIWHLSSLLMLKWPNFSRFFFQWTTITSREAALNIILLLETTWKLGPDWPKWPRHTSHAPYSKVVKAIHFVNSVCTIFSLWKKDPPNQTFPS